MAVDLTAVIRLRDKMSKNMRKITDRTEELQEQADKATREVGSLGDAVRNAGRRMRAMGGHFGGATTAMLGLASAVGGAALAYKGLEASIGGAMQIETNKITLTALTQDAEKANELFDDLQEKAMTSRFSEMEFQGAAKAYLPMTKNIEEINDLLGITERLASSNPMEGMEGASFAIREALSGDYVSLVERFNIPRSTIKNALKGADSVEDKMKAIDGVLTDMGYTQEFVNDVNKAASSQWEMLGSNARMAMAEMGVAALDKLKKPLQDVNEWITGGGMDWIKEKGSEFLVTAVEKAVEFGEYIRSNWPTIKTIASSIWSALQTVGNVIQFVWDWAVKVATYIHDNWSTIKPILVGLVIVLGSLKMAFIAMSIVNTVTKFMKAFKAATLAGRLAMLGLNSAMLMNPMTWIIALIVAAIAVGVLLWKNWDKVKEKAGELWDAIKSAWDSIEDTTANVWYNVESAIVSAINTVVDKINWMIEKINKIPGVNVPIVPKVSAPEMPDSVAQSRGLSPMAASYDGSHYHGLDRVPYDGYTARLHRGEAVLPRKEAKQYRNGGGGISVSISGNTFNVRQESDIEAIADELAVRVLKAAGDGA